MYCRIHHENHKGIKRKLLCEEALGKGIYGYLDFLAYAKERLDPHGIKNNYSKIPIEQKKEITDITTESEIKE
jgi:hypothetical protein